MVTGALMTSVVCDCLPGEGWIVARVIASTKPIRDVRINIQLPVNVKSADDKTSSPVAMSCLRHYGVK